MSHKKQSEISEEERKAYAIVGKLGGKATLNKLGKKHYSNIGKKGAKARWKK